MKIKGSKLHKSLSLVMSPRLAKKHLDKVVQYEKGLAEGGDTAYWSTISPTRGDLSIALYWGDTPQGGDWWYEVDKKLRDKFGSQYGEDF